jgi:hypothetical protein
MTNLFQAEESSPSTSIAKRIAVVIAILAVSSVTLWVVIERLLRLTSGHS